MDLHIVGAEPIGIPPQNRAAGAVIFQHLAVLGVGDEHRRGAVDGLGLAAALRIPGVALRVAGAGRGGQPIFGVDVRCFDDDDNEVPRGTRGEVDEALEELRGKSEK